MVTKNVVVLTVLFSAFCVVMSSAQTTKTPPTPQTRADRTTQYLKKALNLTDDQTAKVETLNLKMFQAQEEMRKAVSEVGKNFKAKMEARDVELQKILTPEQFKQYQDFEHHMKGHMQGRLGHMQRGMKCMKDSVQWKKGNMHSMRHHHVMKSDTTQTQK
jgi:Spy/CpxP family protein refolding chaperone